MDDTCRERILSEDYADFMIDYGEALDNILRDYDACYDPIVGNTVNVFIPISQVPDNFIQLYGYGSIPNCYGTMDTASLEASGVNRIRNIPTLGLRGQGILIGIVDTGIDYTHEAFRYADGTTKIISIWDQSIVSEAGIPEGFSFGTQYTREQINEALLTEDPFSIVPSTDVDGHGTALAGIAAGNENDENNFSGVVPDAELVIVKLKPAKRFLKDFWRIPEDILCYQKNDLMYGIRYLVEAATKNARPLSLIIGIGTSQGGHDERGVLSAYLSQLAGVSGMGITIAGGNEGNRRHHYSGTVSAPSNVDTVELNVAPNTTGFSMEFWGQNPMTFSLDITSPSGEYIPRIPPRLMATREVRFIFERTIINVDYQITEAQSGDQMILVRFRDPTEGIWRFRVYSGGNLTLNYHVWLPIHQFITEGTYFIRPDPNYTLTSPGNVIIPIVTTAYDYSNLSLYINASSGFTRYDDIAPTLAAPGVNLVVPALRSGYTTATGTSIAAAHTAGICAMFLEWGIVRGNFQRISTVEISNLLIRGAKRSPNLAYPNKEWGYGILDIYNAYNALRSDTV